MYYIETVHDNGASAATYQQMLGKVWDTGTVCKAETVSVPGSIGVPVSIISALLAMPIQWLMRHKGSVAGTVRVTWLQNHTDRCDNPWHGAHACQVTPTHLTRSYDQASTW